MQNKEKEDSKNELYEILESFKSNNALIPSASKSPYKTKYCYRTDLKSAASYIDSAILWVDEPEGEEFWSYVYERLEEMGNGEVCGDHSPLYNSGHSSMARLLRFIKIFNKF